MDPLSSGVHGAEPREIRPADAEWPARLDHLTDPPESIWVVGDPALLGRGGVAIVGSRRGTAYGRRIARELGGRLAAAGVPVLSGLALGVDGAAHEGAIERECTARCVAVLGSGPDVIAPRAHAHLYRRVASEGVVASEYAPGTTARRHHFPARNRILAALADEVVVVEAARRSGALITARIALELGRDVHVVPGPIDTTSCEGSNRLLLDGAGPVVSVSEWVAARGQFDLRLSGGRALPAAPWPDAHQPLAEHLADPRTPAELAEVSGIDVAELLGHLVELEVAGLIERLADARYRRVG